MIRANISHADFGQNFLNASGSGDKELLDEVILNEIAILIDDKPLTLIQSMAICGQKFVGTTQGDLVKAVTEMMQKSPKFRVIISTLIALNNGLIKAVDVERTTMNDYRAFRSLSPSYRNVEGQTYHNAGGGPSWIGDIVKGVSDITKGSLDLAAAKANQKSTIISSQSNLEQAQINAEAMGQAGHDATNQELLRTLGIKIASTGSKIPGWVIVLAIVAIGGIIAVVFMGGSKGSVMPASPPVASPPPAPAPPAPVHVVEPVKSVAPSP